ncbi:hypothetical protein CAOG_04477 [Capsaspora owczarzaki ATCC 30864]|uniref:STEEP1 domain-containing protein n=1 Tax=Capsaspora owczarzaki (strain ATCC 30864) TaxID=595528 RepID=A0A0D2VRY3_CAPO3|nr:hypothetical protein CAOG_04477 [Capsaspora owczarzaki ATCC 30864]KJE93727.1 hypothetical protein CAOG_004477 [Capsaspora owczarzaki ATCC 30864]|eukprot:XP_004348305.1 hypothetical protein CAOG_04477 [Capsaspora owczarzaki ATCC 30864]
MQDAAATSASNRLYVYHCYCSRVVLVLDTMLESLPVRITDGSRVALLASQVQKVNAVDAGSVLLQRANGIERQHRLKCARCGLRLFYKATGTAHDEFLYIVNGALFLKPPVAPAIAAAAFHRKNAAGDAAGAKAALEAASALRQTTHILADKRANRTIVNDGSDSSGDEELTNDQLASEYNSNARVVAAAARSKRKPEEELQSEEKRRRKGTLMTS